MKKYTLILLFWSIFATAKVLEVNHDHSKVLFDIDYMKLTTVQGQFKSYSGSFKLDDNDTQISDAKVTIKADSIDTSEAKRDFHLKGHEFFFTASYPTIEFVSTGVSAIGKDKKFKMKGFLTIRGIKKEIVLDGTYKGKMIDPWKKENYFFDLSGEVKRQDFGMKWNKVLDDGGYILGDIVHMKISIQAQKPGDKTPFSTHMVPSSKGIVERDQLKRGEIKKLSTSTDPKDLETKKSSGSAKKD